MKPKLIPRICAKCGRGKGTLAYRFQKDGKWVRDYFHPECFRIMKKSD